MSQILSGVGSILSSSVVDALERLGKDSSLPTLTWQLVKYPDSVVVEGRPLDGSTPGACQRWAEALGMLEYANDASGAVRSWYLNDGAWALELIAEALATHR